jgi:gamma-glutamyl hydrolase
MAPIGFALLALGLDDRPVVGILTLPSIEGLPTNHTYLPASYVKWMESAGARVAPVRFDAPRDELRALADSLNGLVFTGGSNDIFDPDSGKPTPYFDTALFLYNIAAAKDPNALRLWGTCLGFELIASFASGATTSDTFLGHFDAENITLPLDFTAAAARSRLFGGAPSSTMKDLGTLPITMNEHNRGVTPVSVAKNSAIRVLATSTDRNGDEFVSALELVDSPVFATQFHPERPAFEWFTDRAVPHTSAAVGAMSYLASAFVASTRARKPRDFASAQAEQDALIYSWPATDTRAASDYYEQTYFFPMFPAA